MRELYASPNGDRWHLVVEEATGRVFVRHAANAPSGGSATDVDLSVFLGLDRGGPEHHALWVLLRGLVGDTRD